MKRYYLFGGDWYYPSGGWLDFVEDFSLIEDAINYCILDDGNNIGWWHIVDTEDNFSIVEGGEIWEAKEKIKKIKKHKLGGLYEN
uniref:Uncharacterized protein n=1 Tax=viral metagenome TaxID=1070528 RepID=A0A6M3L0B3_9ZZZZ